MPDPQHDQGRSESEAFLENARERCIAHLSDGTTGAEVLASLKWIPDLGPIG
jgi:hypothetical protein